MADIPIVGLGEIALRVDDLDEMIDCYAEVIGLPVLGEFDHATFFEIAEGVAGHTQIPSVADE